MKQRWIAAAIFAGLAGLAFCVLSGVVEPGVNRLAGRDSINLYFLEIYTRSVLADGRLPFWNPYHFAGAPHLADAQTTVLYPPAMLLRWLPPAVFLGWMAIGHVVLGGAGAVFLGRVLGLRWLTSVCLGIAAMLGGSLGGWIYNGHFLLLYSTSWLPLAFGLAIVSVRRGTAMPHLGLAAVLALQFLAGYLQGTLYVGAAIAAYFVYSSIWPEREGTGRWRPLAQLAVLGMITMGLAAFQLLPTLRLAGAGSRIAGVPYRIAVDNAWTFGDFARVLFPFSGVTSSPPHRDLSDNAVYVGWLLTVLAPLAFVDAGKRRAAIFFAALGGLALALAAAGSLPLYQFHYALFPGLRVPGRLLFLTTLSLAVLGAIGLERAVAFVRELRWPPAIATAALVAAIAIVSVDLAAYTDGAVHTVPLAPAESVAETLGPRDGGRALSICESRIGPGETLLHRQPNVDGLPTMHLGDYAEWASLAATGQRPQNDGTFHRFAAAERFPARRDLLDQANTTTFISCDALEAPDITLLSRDTSVYRYRNDRARPRAFWTCDAAPMTRAGVIDALLHGQYDVADRLRQSAFINVRWAPGTDDARRAAVESARSLRDGVVLDGATWRYTLLDTSEANGVALIREPAVEDTQGIDRGTGRVPEAPVVADGPGDKDDLLLGRDPCELRGAVTMVEADRDDGLVVADVDAPAAGLVFLSEAPYVERKAFVDGEPAPLLKANVAFGAVRVPAGRHRVELRFVPVSFYYGAGISGVTATACLAAMVRGIRRDRMTVHPQ